VCGEGTILLEPEMLSFLTNLVFLSILSILLKNNNKLEEDMKWAEMIEIYMD
jgi:hypothetical protein